MMRKRISVCGFILLVCFLSISVGVASAQPATADKTHFQSLQKRLVADGFDQNRIDALYKNSQVKFDTKGVSRFLRHREATLNYDRFVSGRSIRKAKKYLKKYKSELENAEGTYGVDREIITAILLVETRLGAGTGNSSVVSILSTMAALFDPAVKEMLWKNVSESKKVSREYFDKWVERKSKWAYRELNAFLKYTDREKIDPSGVKGSYAGAMGISQFMPSNILIFAKDGDDNGRIDLFTHADAIASVANYLKRNGWHQGIDRKKAHKVVWTYNHSNYYVNIIFKISDKLKG